MEYPKALRPVLAKISHIGDFGKSEWYEVVYFDPDFGHEWCAYAGSKTFQNGEEVLAWRYADECFED